MLEDMAPHMDAEDWIRSIEQSTKRTVHQLNVTRRQEALRRKPEDITVRRLDVASLTQSKGTKSSDDGINPPPAPGTRYLLNSIFASSKPLRVC